MAKSIIYQAYNSDKIKGKLNSYTSTKLKIICFEVHKSKNNNYICQAFTLEARGSIVIKALCYKLESCGFETR
jgi:hypothetical protein